MSAPSNFFAGAGGRRVGRIDTNSGVRPPRLKHALDGRIRGGQMNRGHDLTRRSSSITSRSRRSRPLPRAGAVAGPDDDLPLTPAQLREIRRRVADMRNPVRFILVSAMSPRFMLFYEVSNGTYVLNNPAGATLFKQRDVAEGVRRVLGGRVRIVRCMTRRVNGRRVPILTGALKPSRRAAR